jgi:periplasmic nitrate reductase NapE
MADEDREEIPGSASQEVGAFFLLTAVVAPLVTVGLIAAYGFCVWFYQILTGPPTG